MVKLMAFSMFRGASMRSVSVLAAFFAASVLCAPLHAEDCVVDVAAGNEVVWESLSDPGPAALLADGTLDRTLVKTGGGRLVIACDLRSAGFAGEIRAREGYLRLKHDGACGTPDGGVVVENGATLEGDSSYKSGGLMFKDEPLTFEGFGVNGNEGAVKMVENSTWNFFSYGSKTMTGDSLWNGIGRLDVRCGTFDMGGHVLYCSNSVAIVEATVVNPGKIVFLNPSDSSFESRTDLQGNASNEVVFDGGTRFTFATVTVPATWRMSLSNTVTFLARQAHEASRTNLANAVNCNRWDGPVYLGERADMEIKGPSIQNDSDIHGPDPYRHLVSFNGKVSGPGGVTLKQSWKGFGYLRLGYPENDFAGGVTLESGTVLEAAGLGALGTGPLSIAKDARLELLYGLPGAALTDAECDRLFALKRTRQASLDYYASDTNVTYSGIGNHSYGTDLSDGETIYHDEPNELTLAGRITGKPMIVNTDGTLILGGDGDNLLGEIRVRGGTLRFADGTRHFLGDSIWTAHGPYPLTPRIVIGENATVACRDNADTTLPLNRLAGGSLTSKSHPFGRGILEILPGATVTNQFTVGGGAAYNGTNEMGAVYMRGGTVVQHGDNRRDSLEIGHYAEGYFEMSDGYLDLSAGSEWIRIGAGGLDYMTPGAGVMHMKGGRLVHRSVGCTVNCGGGLGHLRVSGGTASNNTLIVGDCLWMGRKTGGEGVVTVDGAGEISLAGKLEMGAISNSVSVLNLNGGSLETTMLSVITNLCVSSGGGGQYCSFLDAGSRTYVNFGGGTLRLFGGQYWWLDPLTTRITVFADGATVDTGSTDRDMLVPFMSPTGNGVASVEFSCDEPWNYIGAPYVRIVDPSGSGYGATAIAEFDSVNGTISGVAITSPGCDYGEGTYAEIGFGGFTNSVRAAVTLRENDVSGGFTKMGAGNLRLICTNRWHGVTQVAEGRLTVAKAGVLPNTSGFAVASGAVLDPNGFALPPGTLAGCGTVNGDFSLGGTLLVDANDVIARRRMTIAGKLTIAPDTVLKVANASLLEAGSEPVRSVLTAADGIEGDISLDPETFDGRWIVAKRNGSIVFGRIRGLSVHVR